MQILSYDTALKTILDHTLVLGPEEKPLLDATGQAAAEDTYSRIDVPGWLSSARDGFAVNSKDIRDASPDAPRVLRVIEAVMAGEPASLPVIPGFAARIMTGAPVPDGADCIVSFEDTDAETRKNRGKESGEIGILRPEPAGANIGPADEKVRRKNLVVSRGTILGPAEIGVLAALGLTRIKVIRRPVVAIIATGEELTAPGKPLAAAKIYAGSSYALAAQVQRCGAIPQILGIARDTRLALIAKIRRGLKADLIVTTGGVSMGDRDLVKEILSEFGEIFYEGIKMAPGKSCAFALLNDTKFDGSLKQVPHFALSGNPPASMIGFEVLVRPAIRKMMGYADTGPDIVEAVMESRIKNSPGTKRFIWVSIEKRNSLCYASSTSEDPRGMLVSLIPADGIAVIDENILRVEKGDKLSVILLHWK